MSEKQWTIAGVVAAVVFGVPAWWAMFIEHPETLGSTVTVLRAISPIVMLAIGAFTGYKYCAWKSGELRAQELSEKDAEYERMLAAKNAEITEAVENAVAPLRDEIAEKEAIIDKLTAEPSPREVLESLLPGFSRSKLRAIVKAYDADGMVDADDEAIVMASVQSGQGVFAMEAMTVQGMTHTTGRYALTDKFRKALSECPDILERIRRDAS